MLYQITLPYACFGIETNGNVVVDAAPIGKWMIGKNIKEIARWVEGRGGTIERREP